MLGLLGMVSCPSRRQSSADEAASAFEVGTATDVGRVREDNQDAAGSTEFDDGTVLHVVADGMGGALGGAIAAKMTVERVLRQYSRRSMLPVDRRLAEAIARANDTVYRHGKTDVTLAGMGTTCVALVLGETDATVANVGDSRAYLTRGDQIVRLTDDQTYRNELIARGMSADDPSLPGRNVLSQCIGMRQRPTVDITAVEYEPDDIFLLCSDGLYEHVLDEEMAKIVRECPPSDAASQLVAMANERGGSDNITVVVVRTNGHNR